MMLLYSFPLNRSLSVIASWQHKHLLYSHILLPYANVRFCLYICSYFLWKTNAPVYLFVSTIYFQLHSGCRYGPTLKLQTYGCRVDGPCIIYYYALRRWDKMTLVRLVQHTSPAGKASLLPSGNRILYCRLVFHYLVSLYFSNLITDV